MIYQSQKNEGVVDEVDAVRVYKFREGTLTFTDAAARTQGIFRVIS